MADKPPVGLFQRPTSVILCGNSRPLLNWVAYALAVGNPAGVVWTEIKLDGEVREEDDLLTKQRIPSDRYFEVPPDELVLDDFAGNVAVSGLITTDDSPDTVRRFTDFLRLPPHIQALLSRLSADGPAPVLVLSNGQRLSALYSKQTVGPALRSVVESGASLLATWAEAPTESRHLFENVLHLKGGELSAWRDAVLRVEVAPPYGPLRAGETIPLRDFPAVASVLVEVG